VEAKEGISLSGLNCAGSSCLIFLSCYVLQRWCSGCFMLPLRGTERRYAYTIGVLALVTLALTVYLFVVVSGGTCGMEQFA